jgi:hypothetical protein
MPGDTKRTRLSSSLPDTRLVQRQTLGGMLWSKQFYFIDVAQWLRGDPAQPTPERQGATATGATLTADI